MTNPALPKHDIIAIGGSSGALEALQEIVSGLPGDFAAAVFVVVHLPAQAKSALPQILSRAGALPAAHPADNEAFERGRIYVAPPDFHLLLSNGRIRLVRGAKENNCRPAIDPLFRTAARAYDSRVIGVLLSGTLDDGSAGLLAIKTRGGITVVQDPSDTVFPDMPRNAMESVQVDHCLPKSGIAPALVRLSKEPAEKKATAPVSEKMRKETQIEALDMSTIQDENKPGNPSVFGCPECGGTLWEMTEGDLLRFRCRVGHAFGADGLYAAQSEGLDKALWSAFRALEENAALARRLAERAQANKHYPAAEKFEQRAKAAEEQAELIQKLLLSGKLSGAPEGREEQS